MSKQIHRMFSKELDNLEAAGLLKEEAPLLNATDTEVKLPGGKRTAINFCNNDFLGLAYDKDVICTAANALETYGHASTSSRFMTGTSIAHHQLESKIAHFLGYESALVFNSSYMAMLGAIDCLTNENDMVLVDSLSGPGLLDGVRLSNAKKETYLHNDDSDLEYFLKMTERSRFRIIASDGVFATDGTTCNLERIMIMQRKYNCLSIIDDSLGIGLLGETGRGIIEHSKVTQLPDLLCGSFEYALGGVCGGFIAGKKDLISWFRQASRTYTLSAPLSAFHATVVTKALEKLESSSKLLSTLRSNINHFKVKLNEENWQLVENHHPIVSIIIGDAVTTQKMVDSLFQKGIIVGGLCYPNVPQGTARLRVQLTAAHTIEQLDKLVGALKTARTEVMKQ